MEKRVPVFRGDDRDDFREDPEVTDFAEETNPIQVISVQYNRPDMRHNTQTIIAPGWCGVSKEGKPLEPQSSGSG